MVTAAQNGSLKDVETEHLDTLNLDFPKSIPGVDASYLDPRSGWENGAAYNEQAGKLAQLFQDNIKNFEVSEAIIQAGPRV